MSLKELNKVLAGKQLAIAFNSWANETYIFKLLKLDRPLIRETFDSWANETYIVKLMKLDRQLIRETFDSWARLGPSMTVRDMH